MRMEPHNQYTLNFHQRSDFDPLVKVIAFKALKAIPGMSYAGIDIIAEDISALSKGYWIFELNNMPGISLLRYPYVGNPQNPAGALLDLVFPNSRETT